MGADNLMESRSSESKEENGLGGGLNPLYNRVVHELYELCVLYEVWQKAGKARSQGLNLFVQEKPIIRFFARRLLPVECGKARYQRRGPRHPVVYH